jgi:hypothetical protein
MLRRTLNVAMFLLAGVLYPQHGWAAAGARFGVGLVLRDACEIRSGNDGGITGMPRVNCLHGQPYAITRAAQDQQPDGRKAAAMMRRTDATPGTAETWVVTF